jgi:hypothetical protein
MTSRVARAVFEDAFIVLRAVPTWFGANRNYPMAALGNTFGSVISIATVSPETLLK